VAANLGSIDVVECEQSAGGQNQMETKQTQQIIAEMNAALRDEFSSAIASSGWHLLKQTDTVEPKQYARLIVLGVAFWSRPDLQALQMLGQKLGQESVTVFVFNIDMFGYSEGIKAFLPDAAMPNKTPVIAEYLDGVLIRFVEGNSAFKWIKASL